MRLWSVEDKWQRLKELVHGTLVKERNGKRKMRPLGFKDW